MTRPYREKIVTFGADDGLVGVLTTPADGGSAAPPIVLINSGILHRVGANRLYVGLARTCAAAGLTTLRFDLSGVGDSERASGVVSLQDSVHADIAAAVDLLGTRQGADRVVLVGLCSGAFDAFDYALRDARVVGASMIDMPGPFRNWSHLAHYLAARLLRPASWRNPMNKVHRVRMEVRRVEPEARQAVLGPGVRGPRLRTRMAAELDTLLARGVKLSFVFTGGAPASYNHRLQFQRVFPRAAAHPGLRVEFLGWCDHVFSTRRMRAHVAGQLRDWMLAAPVQAPSHAAYHRERHSNAGSIVGQAPSGHV